MSAGSLLCISFPTAAACIYKLRVINAMLLFNLRTRPSAFADCSTYVYSQSGDEIQRNIATFPSLLSFVLTESTIHLSFALPAEIWIPKHNGFCNRRSYERYVYINSYSDYRCLGIPFPIPREALINLLFILMNNICIFCHNFILGQR